MRFLSEDAEEKIKEMDFCIIIGVDESGLPELDDAVAAYLEMCRDRSEDPCSEIEIELYKYLPFPKYEEGIVIEDFIERLDYDYRDEYTLLKELHDDIFQAEKKLYEEICRHYDRYYGNCFATIRVDISDEIRN